MSDPISDVTMSAIHTALNGLALRQRTIADNVANINTPGFLAGRVDFETSLRAAMQDGGDPSAVQSTVARSLEPTNTNGNNVNLDEETLSQVETGLRYQLMTQAMNDQFTRLRTAIGGGGTS